MTIMTDNISTFIRNKAGFAAPQGGSVPVGGMHWRLHSVRLLT